MQTHQIIERSPINGLELRALLELHLTDKTNDREVIFIGMHKEICSLNKDTVSPNVIK